MLGRILVIDDEVAYVEMLQTALEYFGYVTRVENTLAAGRDIARHFNPDLILLDNHFPEGHGDEIIPYLKADCPQTPIVMITANSKDNHVTNAMMLGIDAVVSKPLGLTELQSLVKRYCKKLPETMVKS